MSLSHSPDPEERNHPSQRLATATDRFLAVMQGTVDLFWILTPAGDMQEISPSWQSFTGQPERSCHGPGWLDAVYPADQPQLETMLRQAVLSSQPAESECHIRRSDGVYRLIRLHAFPVCPHGMICELVVSGMDITSEQMSEAQIQLAAKASGVGMWHHDLVTQQFVATDQYKRLLGIASDAPMTYGSFLALVQPDDRERVKEHRARALTEKKDHAVEYRVIWPDGNLHWLTSRARYLFDLDNQPSDLIGAAIDITELKQAEERIVAILESITDAFLQIDREWRFTYANRRANTFLGISQGAFLGQRLWDVRPDLLGTPLEQHLRSIMETRQTTQFDFFLPRPQKWVEVHVYPMQDGLSLYLQDITERTRAEEALRESEERFRHLVDSNIIGITIADHSGIIYEANEAFLTLVGYTQEDMASRRVNWRAMTPPEYQAQAAQAIEDMRTTEMFQPYEKEFVTKTGGRVPVLVGGTLFRHEDSAPSEICFVLDLTARKEMDRQKDLFLGMTSHELKTPLAALRGTLQLVQRRLKGVVTTEDHVSPEIHTFFESLTKNLEDSIRQVDVQTRLINDLLDISRITTNTLKLDLGHGDLITIVRETVEDLRVIVPERVLLLELPEHTVVNVLVDRDRISEVVTNYVTNAIRYASPDQPIFIGLTVEQDQVRVWVRDTGPGLSGEAQKDIWLRYHQVKGAPVQSGSGKGLGLGLYICKTVIAQHYGACGVESTPGEGATFWFTLPIVT